MKLIDYVLGCVLNGTVCAALILGYALCAAHSVSMPGNMYALPSGYATYALLTA